MRKAAPAVIVLAALVGAALTGCSASDDPTATPAGCHVPSGSASEAVSAGGKLGTLTDPKVPSPLTVATSQRTALITGNGPRLALGQVADFTVTLFDGATGAGGQSQSGLFPVSEKALGTGLADALACSTVGSRIAVVVGSKDGAASLGAAEGGSAVAIVDITGTIPSHATGHRRAATPGFPAVVLDTAGRPGIVIDASADAPTAVKSAVLKQGDGAKTTSKDTLIVQTQTVDWSDKTTASGSWEDGTPATQTLADGSALSQELIGKTVGSQVEVLIPKSKSADGQAAVTVVDILAVLPAAAQ